MIHYKNQGGPLSGGLASYVDPDEEARRQQQAQLRHAQFAPQQPGAGDQIKGKVMEVATGYITKALFGFENGGQPMQGANDVMHMIQSAPPEVQQAIEAFLAGQISMEQLMQVFAQTGLPQDMIQDIVPTLQEMKARVDPNESQSVPQGFAEGGMVSGQVEQVVAAVKAGQLDPQQAAQILSEMGIPQNKVASILSVATAPHPSQAQRAPLQRNPQEELVNQVASEIQGNPGPALPSEPQYRNMGGDIDMMAIPSSNPIQKVKKKTKKTRGHDTEDNEVEIVFDTKAMPPMSEGAMSALKNWK